MQAHVTECDNGILDCNRSGDAGEGDGDRDYSGWVTLQRQNDTCYRGTWTAVWEEDGILGAWNPPEFTFTAEYGDEEIESASMIVWGEIIGGDPELPQDNDTFEITIPLEIEFTWSSGTACHGLPDEPYKLQVSDSQSFSDPLDPYSGCANEWISSTQCVVNFDLGESGFWWWRVVVRDQEGNERVSDPRSFEILDSPDQGPDLPPNTWTIVSHGATSGTYPEVLDLWMTSMYDRLDEICPHEDHVVKHTMDAATFSLFPPAPVDDDGKHHVLLFDWSSTAGLGAVGHGYSYAAGEALYTLMRGTGIASRVFAFIGHSRGAVVVSEAVRRMKLDGLEPAQVIFLDGEGGCGEPIGFADDVFGTWCSSSPRYDNIYTTLNEGFLGCGCGYVCNYGGHFLEDSYNYDLGEAFRHGACGNDECGDVPPAWVYLTEGLRYDGQYYTFPDVSGQPSPPTGDCSDPNIWHGHPGDMYLFNGDLEWNDYWTLELLSYAGWWGHGGGVAPIIEELLGGYCFWLSESYPIVKHNWQWIRNRSLSQISGQYKVTLADPQNDDELWVSMESLDGTTNYTARVAVVDQLELEWQPFEVEVPEDFTNTAVRLGVFVQDGGGGGGIGAWVLVDDLSMNSGTSVLVSQFVLEHVGEHVDITWESFDMQGEFECRLICDGPDSTRHIPFSDVGDGRYKATDYSSTLLNGGVFRYSLLGEDLGSQISIVLASSAIDLPPAFNENAIIGAFPNPFNPHTTIEFVMTDAQRANLTVHDIQGRCLKVIIDEVKDVGRHHVTWDGQDSFGMDLSSGVYFLRLDYKGGTDMLKLTLLR